MSDPIERDPDLRAAYDALKVDVERPGAVPDFRGMAARARQEASTVPTLEMSSGGGRVRTRLWWGGTAAALAAAVAGILLTRGSGDADAEFARLVAAYSQESATGAWRSPTARLLDVPGSDLMRSVPSFGRGVLGSLGDATNSNDAEREPRP